MSQTPGVRRINRIVPLSLLIMMGSSVAGAQFARKSSRLETPSISNTTVHPQLLNADTNPTLRFPIAQMSGKASDTSYGWLDITRAGIHYQVEQPPKQLADGFNASRAEIRDVVVDERFNTVNFRGGKKRHLIFYVPLEQWGGVRDGRSFREQALKGTPGSQSIFKTILDFEAMVALVKSKVTPPAPVIAQVAPPPPVVVVVPPAPPAIVVAFPAGVGTDKTVELSVSPLVVRGVAMDSTGMPIISINDAHANMRPQTSQAAEFWSDPIPLQPGANPIRISASNGAHVQTNIAFTVLYKPKTAVENPGALDKASIISLLQGEVHASRVTAIVHKRGIKFIPGTDDLNDIRTAGGSEELIEAIQQATPPR